MPAEPTLAPPPKVEPLPKNQPWAPYVMHVMMSSHRHAVRWAGKNQKLPVNQSAWLDPVSGGWLQVAPDTMFASRGDAADAASCSPQPPGWVS